MWASGLASGVDQLRRPAGVLSSEQAALVNDLVTRNCDTLHEGFLNDPHQCKVDFSTLRCPAGQAGGACLTDAQLETVATFYGGVRNAKRELIFSGAPLGRPISGRTGNPTAEEVRKQLDAGMNNLFDLVRIARNDSSLDWTTFDVDRDVPVLDQKIGFVDAVNPDLRKFKAHGGKLLLYAGWADTTITPINTVEYYQSVVKKMGAGETKDFTRLFMVPGMAHCRGGDGPDTFDTIATLETWREKGVTPATIAAKNLKSGLSRPLCAFPQYAKYRGTGDLKDAANWACAAP
jgi:feruloyl esterase